MTLIKQINVTPSSSNVTTSSVITNFQKLTFVIWKRLRPEGTIRFTCDRRLIIRGLNKTSPNGIISCITLFPKWCIIRDYRTTMLGWIRWFVVWMFRSRHSCVKWIVFCRVKYNRPYPWCTYNRVIYAPECYCSMRDKWE